MTGTPGVDGSARANAPAIRLAQELERFYDGNHDIMLAHNAVYAAVWEYIQDVRPHISESTPLTQDGVSKQVYVQNAYKAALDFVNALGGALASAAGAAQVARDNQPSKLVVSKDRGRLRLADKVD